MGLTQSIQKINYEDVQHIIHNKQTDVYLLINTLSEKEQECLISTTMNIDRETELINKFLTTGNKQVKIIIYGKNCNDESITTKYQQLSSLGFYNLYIYTGGLFEWLLLQDIYGEKEFPTTKKEINLLRFKANKVLGVPLLMYNI
jgi:23S rRNA pseudoU1915 N3-methylase RlmH